MDSTLNTNMQMKVVFITHFILSAWGVQGFWSPDSYFFYNLIFLLTIMWSIHSKDNPEPLQIWSFISRLVTLVATSAIGINMLAIVLDIIVLAIYFPSSIFGSERFSAGMAIVHLVVRPVTSFIMSRNCSGRLGLDSENFTNIFNTPGTSSGLGRSRYEDIDSAPVPPRT